jgi:hypothetical protein
MRENLPFDDFVKKQFSDYSPDVPAHIWENIAGRRSRPKGFWINMLSGGKILLLTAVLLAGGGATYLLVSSNNNSAGKNVSAEKNIIPEKNISPEKNIASDKTTNTSPQENSDEGNSSVLNNESKPEETNVTDNVQEQSANANTSRGNNNSSRPVHRKGIFNSNITSDNSEIKNEENLSVVQTTSDVSATRIYSPFGINNARGVSVNNILSSTKVKLPDCPTLEKNAAGNKKYWEVYAGPDYAFESYKSYGDTASANYLQKRKSSTKFASAFSAGVRYTKVFDNGTSIRTGLNYTQVNEKFIYFNPSEIKYVTVITTRVVIRAPGDTVFINDTLQYQQTGTRTKTTYNRYRNIDVPIVIGYELGNGKIHANINAGVIINVYSWYKGDVLDSLYQPTTITTGKGNSIYQFKNNIGVGFLGSISLYYKITDDLHLLLEPYFRYNLSPISKQNLNLQQKYNIAGLRAGVRFDLK